MPEQTGMTYASSGVDYDIMDPFKRSAQIQAKDTADNLLRRSERLGRFREFGLSRGESAFLIDAGDHYLAHVEEGLGTKNLVADAMYELTGESCFEAIAQDTVAMIVNDMITVGALPLSTAMHLAVGDPDWFKDCVRTYDLIAGWRDACNLAGCIWGGGETPTLKGIVEPGTFVLSGSAVGIVKPKKNLIIGGKIRHGDSIIIIESSGIHANGLTLARKIADKLPGGYLTKLPDGITFGEALLEPTHIYVSLIEKCFGAGIDIHGAINVTGHGWRKFMRATAPFTYVIQQLPYEQSIFDFLQEHGPIDDREAYGNLNMGAGFALYVQPSDGEAVVKIAAKLGFSAFRAGFIEDGDKKVVILPKNIVFEGDTLAVR